MSAFDDAIDALHESIEGWNRGAVPGTISRCAVCFDVAAKEGDPRAAVGAAVARCLAGDHEGARRRLLETTARWPDAAGAYVALGMVALRSPDVLAHAAEASWALIAARSLAPSVGCIERSLAVALAAQGEFMGALQCARAALAIDSEDEEARLWSALMRLYFGGDVTAASVLIELPTEALLRGRSTAIWLGAVAGNYARGEFHEARVSLRKCIGVFKQGSTPEKPLVDSARRWFRELRGFGAGVPMTGERWVRDVGGAQSEYVRTRAALSAFRDAVVQSGHGCPSDVVTVLDIDGALGAMEARARRGMLEYGARLMVRGFAEAYLPMVACLEPPPMDMLAAMGLVRLDG
jgi:tetratricopeptide (TPR) repeat protein